MFNIVEATFSMSLDLYRQSDIQDPNTGAIKKEWSYEKTISCYAKGVISNSSSSRSGDRQVFNNRYENTQYVDVRTTDKLNTRFKVTNICGPSGKPIWTELDYPTETPTVFELIGSTPLTDAFGNILGYNSSLKRSENQQIGL
jgi:hypothetical protein